MTDPDDTMTADIQPLMLEFGRAVFICQCLEESLCLLHALMTHEEARGEEGAFQASWDFHSSKTLGQTVNALRKRIEIPEDLNDYLEDGIRCRNQIVHGFMTKNMMRVMDPKERLQIETELITLKHEVKKRDIIVNKFLDALFKKYGFSNEDLKRRAGEVYAARNNPKPSAPQ